MVSNDLDLGSNKFTGFLELISVGFGLEETTPNITPREKVLTENIFNREEMLVLLIK